MPQEVPVSHNPKPASQVKPLPAGPRAPANRAAKVESKVGPGLRYQFLTTCGEFRDNDVATFEQIHGHGGLGSPDEKGRHTGADVADLIRRGIIEQVPDSTPLTDESRAPGINEDAMDAYQLQQAERATQKAAQKLIVENAAREAKEQHSTTGTAGNSGKRP